MNVALTFFSCFIFRKKGIVIHPKKSSDASLFLLVYIVVAGILGEYEGACISVRLFSSKVGCWGRVWSVSCQKPQKQLGATPTMARVRSKP